MQAEVVFDTCSENYHDAFHIISLFWQALNSSLVHVMDLTVHFEFLSSILEILLSQIEPTPALF